MENYESGFVENETDNSWNLDTNSFKKFNLYSINDKEVDSDSKFKRNNTASEKFLPNGFLEQFLISLVINGRVPRVAGIDSTDKKQLGDPRGRQNIDTSKSEWRTSQVVADEDEQLM